MTDFEKVDRVRRSSADTCLFWLQLGHTRDRSESVFSILETSVFEFHFWNSCCSETVQWILLKFAAFTSERWQLKPLRGYLILIRCAVVLVIWILASLFLEHSVYTCIVIYTCTLIGLNIICTHVYCNRDAKNDVWSLGGRLKFISVLLVLQFSKGTHRVHPFHLFFT